MSTPPACPALPGTIHISEKAYQYPHLDPSRREIRLLSLLPGQLSDEIVCELAVFSLFEEPKYEALSYVWGDPSNPHHVTLNDADFSVTANLYTALQFLRKPDAARTLWIDALCINQECVPEREYQVGLMRSIFSGAEIVLAWLGHPSVDGIVNPTGHAIEVGDALDIATREGSSLDAGSTDPYSLHSRFSGPKRSAVEKILACFAFLRLMKEGCRHPADLPFFESADRRNPQKIRVDRRLEGAFDAFRTIVESAWWDRMWTVQEAMVAKKMWLIHFHLIIPFDNLLSQVNILNNRGLTCCSPQLNSLPRHQFYVFWRLLTKVMQLKREWLGTLWESLTRPSLANLLKKFRLRGATDPRDKINALLGLSIWNQAQPITPSYSIGFAQTYINATMKLIEEEKSLDVLEGHSLHSQYQGLPSWVPDWTRPDRNHLDMHTYLYNAGDSLSKAELCCDSILMVRGVEFDTITSVGESCERDNEELVWPVIRGWARMLVGDPFARETYSTGQSQSDAFKSTMSGDVVRRTASEDDDPPYDYARAGDTFDRRLRGQEDEGDDDFCWYYDPTDESKAEWMQHVFDVVIPKVVQTRFFLTKHGFMGIGPSETAVKDKVFVLRGGSIPFILRHSDDQEHGQKDCYHPPELCFQLVGRSYVHGIMDGQALKDDKKVEQDVHLFSGYQESWFN
ncbi:hypothetical protein BFW01_g10089 [Lasiodiplodia theobromae]|nr:hypothetical protein BFW01_g10089 [Lasiodiplodia theobromae]